MRDSHIVARERGETEMRKMARGVSCRRVAFTHYSSSSSLV